MKKLFILTWAVPKCDGIVVVSSEKLPKFLRDRWHINLVQINEKVKYLATCIESVTITMCSMLVNWVA